MEKALPAGLKEQQLYLAVLIFRIINALCIQTFFNPDEYWQSLEVAHYDVFGFGYKTWEWSPEWKVRSYAYPAIFSVMYSIFKLLHIDTSTVLIYAPKLLHAVGTAITDIMVYKCAQTWFGEMPSNFALLCSVLNWFMFYALPRTFSNSLETYLTMLAMYNWPFSNAQSSCIMHSHIDSRRHALIFAAIACIIRPTNAVIWILPVLREILLLTHLRKYQFLKQFLLHILLIATVSISFLIALDSLYYGELTITPYNFYYFNNTLNGSALYGTHAWHWYFTVGLPTIVGTITPSLFFSLNFLYSSWKKHVIKRPNMNHFALVSKLLPLLICVFTTVVFSFNPHKEFRFLLPILPLLLIYCGVGLYDVFLSYHKISKYIMAMLIITNGFAGLYLAQYHQAAPIQVMKFLNADIYEHLYRDKGEKLQYKDIDVDFLLPCHSTPHFAYLHIGNASNHVHLRFLECSPHFNKNGVLTRDETPSWFLEVNPWRYYNEHLPRVYAQYFCPTYIVMSASHLEFANLMIHQCQYRLRQKYLDNYLEDRYLVVLSKDY